MRAESYLPLQPLLADNVGRATGPVKGVQRPGGMVRRTTLDGLGEPTLPAPEGAQAGPWSPWPLFHNRYSKGAQRSRKPWKAG